ncbi:hypothetical protein BDB00DRAFT_803640 [Zychaea mexicana]|uniref:uncharacterized protein n=1 Tax=Zychaea mexicana TaxID=64656 RepID=UPI0022FDEEFD|nr:uncharacterized protein BDB00DRAFT_803640 [Zychaea mexicana]KAI9497694.1 hypothetical protein BDB00DRAFT_803640 [Zychaea mexicana]
MLEPEVPYDADHGVEEDEDWRDPQIASGDAAAALRVQEQEWGGDDGARDAQGGNVGYDYYAAPPPITESQEQMPEDCWMLPPEYTLVDVLGRNKSKLDEIRFETSTSLKYNEAKHQVDIWGDRESVYRAKHLLDLIVQRLHRRSESSRRKTKKWGKPERELTEKERRRAERKQLKAEEERTFHRFPNQPLSYNAIVPIPNNSIPMNQVLGLKEEFLNRIRADCKCFMNYNQNTNVINVTGENEDKVKEAASRMRNLYLKNARSPQYATLRLLKQPKTNMMVKYRKLPQGYITPRYALPAEQQSILANNRLLEGMVTGVVARITERQNLIDLDDDPQDNDANADSGLSDEMRQLDAKNEKQMINALEMGLASIRLCQYEIKMKIRFGQIVLTDYPNRQDTIPLEDLANKFFPHHKFRSVLAPCIGRSIEELHPLFEWLSSNCIQFTDSPRTSYTVEADQYPQFVQRPSAYARRDQQTAPMEQDKWRTTIIANFTGERRVGLWNLIAEGQDIVTISSADLENDYSWELKLQSAQRFSSMDDMDTPHGQFVESLTLDPETNRLILVPNTRDYEPHLITQKTKWVYALDDWIIEVGRDEVWDIHQIDLSDDRRDLPVNLSSFNPHRVILKFSIYRETWVNRFAENLSLQIGEAPNWTPAQFLANGNENMHEIISVAQQMTAMLSKEVKPYYESLAL